MITDYDIAVEADVQALAQGVRRQMQKGWKPYGPPFLDRTGSLCQALVITSAPVPVDQPNTPLPGYDTWESHDIYPRDTWEEEVGEGATQLGYWTWVRHKMDEVRHDREAGNG